MTKKVCLDIRAVVFYGKIKARRRGGNSELPRDRTCVGGVAVCCVLYLYEGGVFKSYRRCKIDNFYGYRYHFRSGFSLKISLLIPDVLGKLR